jgi:uncharacterized protein
MSMHSLWPIALAGILGAPHCIGMCGGTMTLQSSAPVWRTILAYNSGRILTYTILGLFMGGAGTFVNGAGKIAGLQALASLLGGILTYRRYTLPLAAMGSMRLLFNLG